MVCIRRLTPHLRTLVTIRGTAIRDNTLPIKNVDVPTRLKLGQVVRTVPSTQSAGQGCTRHRTHLGIDHAVDHRGEHVHCQSVLGTTSIRE